MTEYPRFSGSVARRGYNAAVRKSVASALGRAEQGAAVFERWARAALPAPPPAK